MQKICNKPLRQNPFTAYRDPETGRWVIVKESVPTASLEDEIPSQVPSNTLARTRM